ncbi:hypothetical protein ABE61_12445 [Lysinibacillus sphaericus]|uniref:HAD family hydrolase n=1 Tax=Lysinibacillus sphaericus TaxID=1421 RepID=UPI0018CD80A5|nr:HAD family hydrolase [Lysinibacillus sphaericus]MBG9454829.1 hypothetical protein [Lysinibacillus sphaericus]MBG9478257.1 hypothetical protein [Lysinibacillus sphaericus]MBG9590970.1 hypothetical protein [Lysinibacillus sphaericus]
MKYVIIFDMDDTLYEEFTYVQSGFRAVAQYLKETIYINESEAYSFMVERLLQDGRGRIFNELLFKYGFESSELVRQCINVYRYHDPTISLPIEVVVLLKKLYHYPLYIVTDGYPATQERKIKALQLSSYVKEAITSYREGSEYGKPSPYWFKKIAEWEGVKPQQIVYIGDNANKDFVGIKPLGFKTVRVKTGEYRNVVPSRAHEADYIISNLTELVGTLCRMWPEFQLKEEL